MTLVERIVGGVDQIERAEVDLGVVVIALKNRIPHDEVLPALERHQGRIVVGAHAEWENAHDAMSKVSPERIAKAKAEAGAEEYARVFEGKKAIPGVVGALEAVTAAVLDGVELPAPTIISFLHVDSHTTLPVEVYAILDALNSGWQNKDVLAEAREGHQSDVGKAE